MIKVYCHTNLDLHPSEEWPKELPCRPIPGDYIYSLTKRGYNRKLGLRVVSISFNVRVPDTLDVELHIPLHFSNIIEFEKWYKRFVQGD